MNWRGRPLTSHEVIVNLIAATTNAAGLHVDAELDRDYPRGSRSPTRRWTHVTIEPRAFHGDWNYTIGPGTAAPPTATAYRLRAEDRAHARRPSPHPAHRPA